MNVCGGELDNRGDAGTEIVDFWSGSGCFVGVEERVFVEFGFCEMMSESGWKLVNGGRDVGEFTIDDVVPLVGMGRDW